MNHPVKSPLPDSSRDGARKRPTQADVARLAGVSTATVSHVLSGRPDRRGRGSAETRAAVEAAMKQLDYRPNWAGRALRRQRTGLVGAVVSQPSNPWQEALVATAQRELARHSLDLVIFPKVPGPELSARFFDLLDRRAVDACFTLNVEERHLPRALADSPVPVVAFAEEGFAGVPVARHEYAAAATEAVEVLRSRGVRRFMLLTEAVPGGGAMGRDFVDPVRRRLAADADGLVVPPRCEIEYGIRADLTPVDWAALEDSRAADPIVVMCSSDRLAIQVWAECRRRGLAIGRDLGVVGRGDIADASRAPVSLSTLGTAGAEYGEVFSALAAAANSGERIQQGWTFPWHVIERESTAGLRVR